MGQPTWRQVVKDKLLLASRVSGNCVTQGAEGQPSTAPEKEEKRSNRLKLKLQEPELGRGFHRQS